MAILYHHRQRAEGGGGPQDRADIVGVGELVEHQHDLPLAAALCRQEVVQVPPRQGIAGQCHTLVHRALRQKPGNGVGSGRLHSDP